MNDLSAAQGREGFTQSITTPVELGNGWVQSTKSENPSLDVSNSTTVANATSVTLSRLWQSRDGFLDVIRLN